MVFISCAYFFGLYVEHTIPYLRNSCLLDLCSSEVVNDLQSSSFIFVACQFHIILGLHLGFREFFIFRLAMFSRFVLIIVECNFTGTQQGQVMSHCLV